MSSFGNGEGNFDFSWTLGEFLHSVVVAGRIKSLTREVSGNRVGIAVVGESWQFTADELAEWNGNKLPTSGEDPDAYWFSEGFTNYFARKILLRSGLISQAQYLADLDQALQAYDANPLRLAANSEIQSGFWNNSDASQLPYRRGDMLAVMLDEQIQIKSMGRYSLDDVMLDILRKPLSDEPVTSKTLFVRLEPYMDPETMSRVEASILGVASVAQSRENMLDLFAVNSQMHTCQGVPSCSIERTEPWV